MELSYEGKSVFVTVIDQCGPPTGQGAGADAHFDISEEAFTELFGDLGVSKGSMFHEYRKVSPGNCNGNIL